MLLDDEGEEQSYSQNMPVNTDLHFYASWQKRVTITFDAQGGIVGETEREITPGKIGSLPSAAQPVATRKDYEFVRWYQLDDEGNKTTVNADTSFDEDATVYAEWRVIKRRLRFETNGGALGKNPATNDYWATDWLDDLDAIKSFEVTWFPEVTNHGYTLRGWYTKTSGGQKVELGDVLNLQEVGALYAQWDKADWVKVTFNSAFLGIARCSMPETVETMTGSVPEARP
jgi:uncharacterized repeat protein (TIGR02543 family)